MIGLAVQRAPWRPSSLLGRIDAVSRPKGSRGFYFPRDRWFPWRQKKSAGRRAALERKRHIWPRYFDADEDPIVFKDDKIVAHKFQKDCIPLSIKRMQDYTRLLKGRQLQDGIDWLACLARPSSQPLRDILDQAMKECTEVHAWDPARIWIYRMSTASGFYMRRVKFHTKRDSTAKGPSLERNPRHKFMLWVREMPLPEFFHRMYIFNKVPRSIRLDMRCALVQKKVPQEMEKVWAPYLNSRSRFKHRYALKWRDCTRDFDYYTERRKWIDEYEYNRAREENEARAARGLPPKVAR